MKVIKTTEGHGNRGKEYEYKLEQHEEFGKVVYVVAKYLVSNIYGEPVSHARFDSRDAAYQDWATKAELFPKV